MITDSATIKQLRRELWELIRFWRYDCYFEGSKGCPCPHVDDMEFTPHLMHALSYWKFWLASKKDCGLMTLTARYNKSNCDRYGRVAVNISPDHGEFDNIDYTLFDNNELLCLLETEYGPKKEHTEEDFPKLCKYKSPLKVMVNSDLNYSSKIKYMQDTIQSYIASGHIDPKSNEEWLFLGFPYMKKNQKWPTKPSEVVLRMHTLSFPYDGQDILLRQPDWNVWEKNEAMEEWIRSQH